MALKELSAKTEIRTQTSPITLDTFKSVIFGNSLLNLKSFISDFARFDHSLLFIGERGTGKEMFADFYIQESQRKKNFETINCAAGLGEDLLRSELFGHVKGAFTGADREKEGLFKKIDDGGGIFLDELGDASPNFHATLLRVLESGDYLPLGSLETKQIKNVRIIAATSKVGKLRKDLRDRFKVVYIPPLAKRRGDIPEIIKAVWNDLEETQHPNLQEYAIKFPQKISQRVLDEFEHYNWPGNFRELENSLELAILLNLRTKGDTLRANLFPTIPNLSNPSLPDKSKGLIIKELKIDSQPLPIEEFLKPPIKKSKEGKKTEEDSQTDLPMLTEDIFNSVIPAHYSDAFYKYWAKGGIKAADLVTKFNKSIPASTCRQKLREVKDRLNIT
jgi:transcriptional regulator with PAS, ATPase and Fis domain